MNQDSSKPILRARPIPSVTDPDWRPLRAVYRFVAELTSDEDLADHDVNAAIVGGYVPVMHRSTVTGEPTPISPGTWLGSYNLRREHVYPWQPHEAVARSDADLERILFSPITDPNPKRVPGVFYLWGPAVDDYWSPTPHATAKQGAQPKQPKQRRRRALTGRLPGHPVHPKRTPMLIYAKELYGKGRTANLAQAMFVHAKEKLEHLGSGPANSAVYEWLADPAVRVWLANKDDSDPPPLPSKR